MYLTSSNGSKVLLEFLRNLTPQVLLLSSALILFSIWQEKPDSYIFLVLAIGMSAMCLMAMYANANNFIDNAISDLDVLAAERDRLNSESIHGFARIRKLTAYTWKEKRGAFLELAIAICFIYITLFVVLVASVVAAFRTLK